MHHHDFATGTITAGFTKHHRSPAINVNEKRELPQMGKLLALRTLAQAHIFMGIQ
jgi:hypothetical protein